MDLREQEYICAIAKTGSLTEASKLLLTSQPNLSLFVSNLEERLNIKLFDRIGKRFRLTYAGELYVEKAEKMLRLRDEFNAEMFNLTEFKAGRLRLGFQYFRSSRLIPTFISLITKEYPLVQLSFVEETLSKLELSLLNNNIDMFFCNCPVQLAEFEYHPIFKDSIYFMTSSEKFTSTAAKYSSPANQHMSYPWIDLKSFENERFILSREGGSLRAFSDQILRAVHVTPKHMLTFDKVETVMELVARGLGVGFCMDSYRRFVSLSQPLQLFSVGNDTEQINFCAVYMKGKFLPAYSVRAIEIIAKIMNDNI